MVRYHTFTNLTVAALQGSALFCSTTVLLSVWGVTPRAHLLNSKYSKAHRFFFFFFQVFLFSTSYTLLFFRLKCSLTSGVNGGMHCWLQEIDFWKQVKMPKILLLFFFLFFFSIFLFYLTQKIKEKHEIKTSLKKSSHAGVIGFVFCLFSSNGKK